MAYTKVTGRNFYVYIFYRGDWITPFYVGKGCGQRWLVHEKEALRRTCRKSRVIQSMWKAGWYEIPKRKLAENLTDDEAKALEIRLIAEIGREPNGPLVNHTDGGDGVSNLSDEARAKKSAANVISWADPEVRRKRTEGMSRALGPAKPKPPKPPKIRKKTKAQIKKERLQDPEYQAERAEEIREKKKKRFEDPEVKAAFVAAARTPEVLLKRGANMSANLQTPEGYARRCTTMQANWDRRKAEAAAQPLPLFAYADQNDVPSENEMAAQLFQSIPGPVNSDHRAPPPNPLTDRKSGTWSAEV